MLKNYIKIAWRNITKNGFYTVVNIIGLAAGIAFTQIIGAYVWGELQVNRGLKNAGQQYILQSKWKDGSMGYELTTLAELPKALKTDYPAWLQITIIGTVLLQMFPGVISISGKVFKLETAPC